MTIVGLVYMFWTNPIKCKCCNKRESSMKMDINSGVYATYSRGRTEKGNMGTVTKFTSMTQMSTTVSMMKIKGKMETVPQIETLTTAITKRKR